MNSDLLWLLLSVALVAVAAALWVRKRMKLRRARNWPTEAGRVDSTDVRLESRGDTQSVYVAEVTYSYSKGENTSGGKLRRTYLLKGHADKWVALYPQGRAITIRRNPDHPADVVLFEDEQSK
jgi:hypothetical protein